ncbi:MAG: PilZ domain-containing protein [Planctomycetaceae bacterium]
MPEDRRASWRLPLAEGRPVMLKIGWRRMEGRCVDMSAGGFTVALQTERPVDAGAPIKLLTPDGVYVMKVIHVRRDADGLRLGLERVGEVEPAFQQRRSSARRRWFDVRRSRESSILAGFAVWAVAMLAISLGPDWWSRNLIGPIHRQVAPLFDFGASMGFTGTSGGAPASFVPTDNFLRPPVEKRERNPVAFDDYASGRRVDRDRSWSSGSRTQASAGSRTSSTDSSWSSWASKIGLSADQSQRLRSLLQGRSLRVDPQQLTELSASDLQPVYSALDDAQKSRLEAYLSTGKGGTANGR